jgi:hypothetical protein
MEEVSETAESAGEEDSLYVPARGDSPSGDFSGERPSQLPRDVERIRSRRSPWPDSSEQRLFAVINIIAGIIFCCLGGGIALIFAIIAAVLTSKADQAYTPEEAAEKLGTAKAMNFIALGMLLFGLAVSVGLFFFVPNIITNLL